MRFLTLSRIAASLFVLAGLVPSVNAGGEGTSGGLTLLEAAGARAAALGEAFSAASEDVTSAAYNPAALGTLSLPQVSFSYQKGISDDASGRLHFGKRNFGAAISYYTAGDVELLDAGGARSVEAQKDLVAAIGLAREHGRFLIGGAFKFISSQLAESDRASAFAVDLGAQTEISPRFRLAAALQNLGTELKFVDEGDPLPRVIRAGAAAHFKEARFPTTVYLEAPYFMNEQALRPAAGVEVSVGVLSLRAGYKAGSDIEGLSLGTGFAAGNLMIDYAFGFVDDLDSRQRISVGYRFGAPRRAELSRTAPAFSPLLAEVPR